MVGWGNGANKLSNNGWSKTVRTTSQIFDGWPAPPPIMGWAVRSGAGPFRPRYWIVATRTRVWATGAPHELRLDTPIRAHRRVNQCLSIEPATTPAPRHRPRTTCRVVNARRSCRRSKHALTGNKQVGRDMSTAFAKLIATHICCAGRGGTRPRRPAAADGRGGGNGRGGRGGRRPAAANGRGDRGGRRRPIRTRARAPTGAMRAATAGAPVVRPSSHPSLQPSLGSASI